MFLLQTGRDQLNLTAQVKDLYPKFDRRFGELSKTERREYQRLAKLVRFQHNIPDFVKKELSRENVTTMQGLVEQERIVKLREKKLHQIDNQRISLEEKRVLSHLKPSNMIKVVFD